MKEDILLQDNKSLIILYKNYLYWIRKGIKYINTYYFFITDKIKKKKMKIAYCPTEDIVVDYSSKPIQGTLPAKHHSII